MNSYFDSDLDSILKEFSANSAESVEETEKAGEDELRPENLGSRFVEYKEEARENMTSSGAEESVVMPQAAFDGLSEYNADEGVIREKAVDVGNIRTAVNERLEDEGDFSEDPEFDETEFVNDRRAQKKGRNKPEDEYDDEPKKTGKKWLIPVIIILLFLGAAAYGLNYQAKHIDAGNLIFPNVYIDGIEVGNMTPEEAAQLLESCNWEKNVSGSLEVRMPMDVKANVDYVKAGVRMSQEDAIAAAAAYGREENIYRQLYTYVNSLILPIDVVEREIVIDSDYVKSVLNEAVEEFNQATADNKYKMDIEASKFEFLKGAGEVKIDEDELYAKVETALRTEEESVTYRVGEVQLTAPDFKSILEEVKAAPSDAYYDEENDEIVKEVVGVEFDPATALEIWKAAEPLSYVEIPLFTTPAAVTEKDLKEVLFHDVLGEYTTSFAGSIENRCSNINLAVNTINDIVLMPGEKFSYNETLGERTAEKGYLEAAAYDNGEVIEALGGGICQVSSTLCTAARLAQMDYTRVNHQFKVTYIDTGLDATVDYTGFENGKGVDFTFTNNREYPIRILASCDNEAKTVTIQILGTDVDGSHVEFKNEFFGYLRYRDLNDGTGHSEAYNSTIIGEIWTSKAEVYDADGNWMKEIYSQDNDYLFYMYHKEDVSFPYEPEAADDSADESAEDEG